MAAHRRAHQPRCAPRHRPARMAIAADRGLYNLHGPVSRSADSAARECSCQLVQDCYRGLHSFDRGSKRRLVGVDGRSCDVKIQDMMDVVRVPSSDADTPSIAPVRPPREQPRAAMVGWYHPVQLVRTALSIATSSIIGRNVDQRELEALHERTLDYFDYSLDDAGQPRRDLWLDFVADTGDGFDSTYAVASAVARDSLDVADPTGATHATQRGRILVFGGDLVYPVASREQYEQRTVMPYEHALPHSSAPHPDVFAIPGNHDWYDSLISFTRRFCSERWFAGWRTRQHVSYFALQLPHDWWLIGTDVQLDSDIDADQVRYFRAIAKKLTPRSRIILCNAEPHWIYEKIHDQDRRYLGRNLNFLEEKVFQRRIAVYLRSEE